MKLRVARHTKDLPPIINFYRNLLGLEILGEFRNHDGYNGVFLGKKDTDWHLEFTVSAAAPSHTPDKDDLLIFYPASEMEYRQLIESFKKAGVQPVQPENPYWAKNGTTYPDPDGFRVVIVQKR